MPRGSGTSGIIWVRNEISPHLMELPSKLRKQIAKEFAAEAPKVQEYMKRNAPWQDRTGDARAGLTAVYVGDRFVERSVIRLSHGVPYGIFLETRNAGRYAIIVPTLVDEGNRIMEDMGGLLERLGKGTIDVSFSAGNIGEGLLV